MPTDRALEEELTDLAGRIERLRVLYQQYFMGLERMPPLVQREQLERRIRESPLNEARRATYKFRFQSLVQRLRTYEVYWDRLQRDIEEGRIERGVIQEGGLRPARVTTAEERPVPPALELAPRPLESASPDPVEALYRDFLNARERVGLPVEGITLDAFRLSIERQRRIHAERLGVPDVSFTVAIKDGKVVLQARPVPSTP